MTMMEPSPEQITEWVHEAVWAARAVPLASDLPCEVRLDAACEQIARLAYAAGADAELEACVEWIDAKNAWAQGAAKLRTARRPKPPSLKQQAMEALLFYGDRGPIDTIRRAIESLPDD